jgi:hypothetical protein
VRDHGRGYGGVLGGGQGARPSAAGRGRRRAPHPCQRGVATRRPRRRHGMLSRTHSEHVGTRAERPRGGRSPGHLRPRRGLPPVCRGPNDMSPEAGGSLRKVAACGRPRNRHLGHRDRWHTHPHQRPRACLQPRSARPTAPSEILAAPVRSAASPLRFGLRVTRRRRARFSLCSGRGSPQPRPTRQTATICPRSGARPAGQIPRGCEAGRPGQPPRRRARGSLMAGSSALGAFLQARDEATPPGPGALRSDRGREEHPVAARRVSVSGGRSGRPIPPREWRTASPRCDPTSSLSI